MRSRALVAALFVVTILAVSCIFLNLAVQQSFTQHQGARESTSLDVHSVASQLSLLARTKVAGIVGVQTGFSKVGAPSQYKYEFRRQALRKTWFPASQKALDEFERKHGLVLRFVIGHSLDQRQELALEAEAEQHGGFHRLSIKEAYTSLTDKTLEFLRTITVQYDAKYIVKVDDDVFLRVDRLPHAFKQWDEINADYIGCMKTGAIVKDPHYRWFEPQHEVLGSATYFTHSWGSLYVVSGRIAAILAQVPPGTLRFFSNEDVTIGSWMLAFNTTHMDDRRMCMPKCEPSSIGVFDMPLCAGLCDPVKQLPQLWSSADCSDPALHPGATELPRIRPIFRFQRRGW